MQIWLCVETKQPNTISSPWTTWCELILQTHTHMLAWAHRKTCCCLRVCFCATGKEASLAQLCELWQWVQLSKLTKWKRCQVWTVHCHLCKLSSGNCNTVQMWLRAGVCFESLFTDTPELPSPIASSNTQYIHLSVQGLGLHWASFYTLMPKKVEDD